MTTTVLLQKYVFQNSPKKSTIIYATCVRKFVTNNFQSGHTGHRHDWIFKVNSSSMMTSEMHPSSPVSVLISVTRLGYFLELLGSEFYYNSSPNILVFFGLFQIIQLSCKKWYCYFLGDIGKKLGNFLFHHLVTLVLMYI